jgi:5-methylcytosine-specific restriction endonuclease McrA
MSSILVIDQNKQPCDPVHPGQARRLLKGRKAAVYRRYPLVLILKEARQTEPHALRVKLDPGATTTGIAVVDDRESQVVWAAELTHRGFAITEKLHKRRAQRRGRRQRHTRYRQARYHNRRRVSGWIAPSLRSRADNILTWVSRLSRWCPVTALSVEVVKFDTQALVHPEIDGVQYQQGTLFGYELKQYLLEKWGRRCAYCQRTDCPLQIEHLMPKSRGGSDRVTNLTLACEPCNQAKGAQTAQEYGFPQLQAQAQRPLRDAAAVNSTRRLLYERLKATGLPVETGTGGMTQFHRVQQGLPKQHWVDAAVVGPTTPKHLSIKGIRPWLITATGRQCRQMCNVDGHGFPRGKPKRCSMVKGFRTGDLVKAVCPSYLKAGGIHVGRVMVRARGVFDITTSHGRVKDIPARYCRAVQHADGYAYHSATALPPHG